MLLLIILIFKRITAYTGIHDNHIYVFTSEVVLSVLWIVFDIYWTFVISLSSKTCAKRGTRTAPLPKHLWPVLSIKTASVLIVSIQPLYEYQPNGSSLQRKKAEITKTWTQNRYRKKAMNKQTKTKSTKGTKSNIINVNKRRKL
jgi:hypothetical protein